MAGRQRARRLVGAEAEREPAERRLEQRSIHDAALAGELPAIERGDAAERRPHTGAEIEQLHPDAGRRRFGRAVDAEHAGERLHDRLVPGLHLHRPVVAERPQRAIDEPGVRGTQARRVEAEILHDARPHVLHQHVAATDVLLEPGDRRGITQIQREAALVVIHGVKRIGGIRREQRTPIARVIAAVRPLELDHVGTQVGEDPSRERARQILGDLDHLDPAQRQHDSNPLRPSFRPSARRESRNP